MVSRIAGFAIFLLLLLCLSQGVGQEKSIAGKHDQAVEQLEETLRRRDFFTRAWFRIDSTFKPLRDHPRFRQLVSEKSP